MEGTRGGARGLSQAFIHRTDHDLPDLDHTDQRVGVCVGHAHPTGHLVKTCTDHTERFSSECNVLSNPSTLMIT